MSVSATQVKELRQMTGAGMMDCKKALEEAQGDMEKARRLLREKGIAKAFQRAQQEAKEGAIVSYLHMGGKIGVLVELNCETDFVAKTEEFQELAKQLAMHICSERPLWISKEDAPQEVLEREKELYASQALKTGKPEKVVDKIVEGKMKSFYQETCLLEQPFNRQRDITIQELLNQKSGLLGEKVMVRRFARYQLGEEM